MQSLLTSSLFCPQVTLHYIANHSTFPQCSLIFITQHQALPTNFHEKFLDYRTAVLNYTFFFVFFYSVLFVMIYSIVESLRTVHASRILHEKMLHRLLRAPMSFFDTTPLGRIVNRFSKDIDTIDSELPLTFIMGLDSACFVLSTLIVISYSTPYFLIAILPLLFLYLMIQVSI